MKVSYRGVQKEFPPKIQEKLDAKFLKLSKLLERRGEKEAHVVLTSERHLHQAEITVQYYDHQLVGIGSDSDEVIALNAALEKLEKQAVKLRDKWREKGRRSDISETEEGEPASAVAAADESPAGKRVFRIDHHERRKPMTLEEAILEMEDDRDYLVYRDADRQCVSVLIRRRDGNFDLIES
ncbi:MAG: ribosome-associated translation inhibitor RaiA [Bryobacteraceae bacterium]